MSYQTHFSGEFKTRKGKCGFNKGRGRAATLWAVTLWALAGTCSALHNMQLDYTWGTYDFAFQDDQQRQKMLARSDYAPENQTAFDVDSAGIIPEDRTFIAFAAMRLGSQVALATIVEKDKRDSPLLAPYPDWSWHAGHRGCGGMTSVFRIYIDKCRRLWAIDSGVVDIGNTFQHQCPPQLFVFDLTNDSLLASHNFSIAPAYNSSTLLLNVIAEQVGASCNDDAYAYVADPLSFAIYVFSLRSRRSWRVDSRTFLPDSNASLFEINGTSFTMEESIMGIAQNDKYLYYHSFTSFQEARVRKSVLRNKALFADGTNLTEFEFNFIGSRTSQSAGETMAKNDVLFFHQMGTDSIYCWDASTKYTEHNQHVVEHDGIHLHFVSNMKIINRGRGDELLAIDNNGQRLFAGEYEPNLPNTVNVVSGPVRKLSSKCKVGWHPWAIYIWKIFFWW